MGATITATLVHPGPSRWSARPAIELRVDWPAPVADTHGAWRSLSAALASHGLFDRAPAMIGDPRALAGFDGRAFDPALAAAIVAVALQRAISPIPRGDDAPRAARAADRRTVVYGYLDPVLGRGAGRAAVELVALQLDGPPGEPRARLAQGLLDRFAAWAPGSALDTAAMEMVAAARRRAIPVERAGPQIAVLRFGQGARQRMSWISFTSATPHIATILASNKHAARALLHDAGLPVPAQAGVASLPAALRAAARIGYPVVVKPAATDRGIGVSAGLRDAASVETAYRRASASGSVLVEKHIDGDDHRMLVIGGRLVRTTRRDPASVTGNGRDSVADLVRAENLRRRDDPELYDVELAIDDEARRLLAQAGLAPESVVPAGHVVALKSNANISTGGGYAHVDAVHPDNAAMAVRAAATLGLDVAGVDFITTDVGRPWAESGGAICEVNPTPHLWRESAAHDQVLDTLFAGGADGRIPIVLVVAPPQAGAPWRARARDRLRVRGARVGVAWERTFEIGGVVRSAADTDPAHPLIVDATVDAAVVERTPDALLDAGLAFDRCRLAIVAGIAANGARDELLRLLAAVADEVWVDPPADALDRWDPSSRPARV